MKTCFFQVSSSIDINLNKEQTYNVLSFNYSLNAEKRMFIQPLNVLISLVNTCTNALIRLKLKTIFGIQAKEFCNWTDTSSNIILYSLIFKGLMRWSNSNYTWCKCWFLFKNWNFLWKHSIYFFHSKGQKYYEWEKG